MTDREFHVLERITAWHIIEAMKTPGASLDYHCVEAALRMLHEERRGMRPVTFAIVPLVENPDLIRASDWRTQCALRCREMLAEERSSQPEHPHSPP